MDEQRRLILTIVLSGVILFGWQLFFAPPSPQQNSQNNTTDSKQTVAKADNGEGEQAKAQKAHREEVNKVQETAVSREVVEARVENDLSLKLSNFLEVLSLEHPSSLYPLEKITGSEEAGALQIFISNGSQFDPLELDQLKFDPDKKTIRGSSQKWGVTLDGYADEFGKFHLNFRSQTPYRYRFQINAKEEEGQVLGFGMGGMTGRQHAQYYQSVDFTMVGDSEEERDKKLKWFGIDHKYHIFALILDEPMPLDFYFRKSGKAYYTTSTGQTALNIKLFVAKKDYDFLVKAGDNLHGSVDFGVFAILAVPILRGLQFCYNFIPNYGIAIILLTLFIRLVTFPLNYKSMKSMKKMQLLQPEMAKIKEKYQDDPKKMQEETMALFKRAKANPLGGCLPLLLQMPFFFAFYQVLYNAVELVGAPFFGWISDLSVKDPYYVLPLAMTLAMVLNQKIIPTTITDPLQKKIMFFMPIFFGFIMKDFPAGLSLYIFISTVFGIGQQLVINKSTQQA